MKRVTISLDQVPLDEALDEISRKGNFIFSYNSDRFDLDQEVTIDVEAKAVGKVLNMIFDDNVRYRVVGSHVILLGGTTQPNQNEYRNSDYIISGYIIDSRTGQRIKEAIAYEVDGRIVAISNSEGYYSMTLPGNKDQQGVSFSKRGYLDTVIIVRPAEKLDVDIWLYPSTEKIEKIQVAPTQVAIADVHDRKVVNMFVPDEAKIISDNLDIPITKPIQVSLVPYIGTNMKISGSVNNVFSLNLLVGYAGGVNGFELGGLMNIDRNNVNGWQIGGVVNFVGGRVRGMQLAGFFNKNSGSIYGAQIAGFNNLVLDTITGLQLAGFQNTLHGRMDGVQLSGFNNVTTQNVDGLQLTGFANVALKDVKLAQVAGFANYADNVDGIQVGGFANVAKGAVNWGQISGFANYGKSCTGIQIGGFANVSVEGNSGGQISGFANYAQSVEGVQMAGFANVSGQDIKGAQISGFINYAKKVNGLQLSTINYCDTVESGVVVGLFSYVRHGFHRAEIYTDETFYGNLAFKSGVKRFYNIFSAGYGYKNILAGGYGIGTQKTFNSNLDLSIDLTSNVIFDVSDMSLMGSLNKLSLSLDVNLNKYLTIFAAPVLNVYAYDTDLSNASSFEIAPYTVYDETRGTQGIQVWVGGKAGLAVKW